VHINEARARWLATDPMVAYVQQDRRVSAAEVQQAPPSWGLDRIDRAAPALDGRYVYPSRAASVTAYVIDTGIRISHSTFGGRASYGWDFVDDDPVADDCNGHGTHVAGTIGGSQYGVAKGVQLIAVRVLDCDGTGFYSQIIAGVDWVTEHAVKPAVANMSISGPTDSALDKAVRASIASGVTYAVAAGGAGGRDIDLLAGGQPGPPQRRRPVHRGQQRDGGRLRRPGLDAHQGGGAPRAPAPR
jgi:subtilisin family serine protease